jgi:reactive chlorine resistance protein C
MATVQIRSHRKHNIDAVGSAAARYGLAVVIGAFGLLKFTEYEAQGIAPLVSESPFMSWLYEIFSVYTFSVLLGVFEVAAAVLIAVKPWWPRASILGSALAILLFVVTISFLFTTPGAFDPSVSYPAPSLTTGFLFKDVALLGISVWTLADALRATPSSLAGSSQLHAT